MPVLLGSMPSPKRLIVPAQHRPTQVLYGPDGQVAVKVTRMMPQQTRIMRLNESGEPVGPSIDLTPYVRSITLTQWC